MHNLSVFGNSCHGSWPAEVAEMGLTEVLLLDFIQDFVGEWVAFVHLRLILLF